MAFGEIKQSKESAGYKRYIGVCPVFVEAINPTKEQQETIFNTVIENEPVYLTENTDNEGKTYKQAKVTIILKPDKEKTGIEDMPCISMSMFLQQRYAYNKDKNKVKVIDKFGRTAWIGIEDAKAKKIPLSKSSKPFNIDADYRPAYIGEEELTNFTKAYLCIDNITIWNNTQKAFVINTKINPASCECRFDNLNKVFSGDFSEITSVLGSMPTNKVKVLLGIRTNPESGQIYQSVLTRAFVKNSSNNYYEFDKEVTNMNAYATSTGRALNTQYEVIPVHEYEVIPTTIVQNTTVESPVVANTNDDDIDELPWL